MEGWLCLTSTFMGHPDGYIRELAVQTQSPFGVPWAHWAGAEQVRTLAVPWLGARLCPYCSCMARVKTKDRKSRQALGNMGLHLFSLQTLQQEVDIWFFMIQEGQKR